MKNIVYFLFVALMASSCDKQNEWLDAKRQKEMVIPETLKDFQALLDMFSAIHNALPIFGLVGSDDFQLTDVDYNRVAQDIRNGYIWNREIWSTDNANPWTQSFGVILRSNVVLDGLAKLEPSSVNQAQYNDVQGQAYFYRALFYYNLTQLFCKAYSHEADHDLGLPLRLSPDVNVVEPRATLAQTYERIVQDATSATQLLPTVSENNRRPSKAAAYALLAKVYLNIGNYEQAVFQATEALELNGELLDFNSGYASTSQTYRFPANPYDHPEILFYGRGGTYSSVMPAAATQGIIDRDLYEQYDDRDLRKSLFFFINVTGQIKYRGSYTGATTNFCGIATNEVYLIRAESHARLNQTDVALADLNKLLEHRYETSFFNPVVADSQDQVLREILKERRKELVGVSNLRWEDLKRLNREQVFQITIRRELNGQIYTLEPNSPLYVLPIPNNEIQLSNIIQNER